MGIEGMVAIVVVDEDGVAVGAVGGGLRGKEEVGDFARHNGVDGIAGSTVKVNGGVKKRVALSNFDGVEGIPNDGALGGEDLGGGKDSGFGFR